MNSGKYTIDRFEGDLAILLFRDDESIDIVRNRSELPQDASEGDILLLEFDSKKLVSSIILKEETEKTRKKAQELLNKLKNK